MASLRASPAFALSVLITLGLAGFNGLMVGLMTLRLNFLLPGPFAHMTHFQEVHHRIHDLTFGFIFLPTIVGMLAQLRQPSKNAASQMMALIPSVGLVLTLVLTFVLTNNTRVLQAPWVMVGVGVLISTALHPAKRDFSRSFSVARINWVMLTLVIVAAVPLLAFAATNVGLQGTITDDHVRMGHYGFMAAFSSTVIGAGLLASLRPNGWRLTAWVAGLLPTLLGISSMTYPDATSSLGPVWALAAIAWGVTFVAAAEFIRRGVRIHPERAGMGVDFEPTASTPGWVHVLGIIAIFFLILVFVGMHLTGSGLGGHKP